MDYICDWARDVYRLNTINCLSNGEVDIRDITSNSISLPLRRSSAALVQHETISESEPEDGHFSPAVVANRTSEHETTSNLAAITELNNESEASHLTPFSVDFHKSGGDSAQWPDIPYARAPNEVTFSFFQVSLPDNPRDLK